jgi:hypothetical protein
MCGLALRAASRVPLLRRWKNLLSFLLVAQRDLDIGHAFHPCKRGGLTDLLRSVGLLLLVTADGRSHD